MKREHAVENLIRLRVIHNLVREIGETPDLDGEDYALLANMVGPYTTLTVRMCARYEGLNLLFAPDELEQDARVVAPQTERVQ